MDGFNVSLPDVPEKGFTWILQSTKGSGKEQMCLLSPAPFERLIHTVVDKNNYMVKNNV